MAPDYVYYAMANQDDGTETHLEEPPACFSTEEEAVAYAYSLGYYDISIIQWDVH